MATDYKKKGLFFFLLLCLSLYFLEPGWALNANYNRPNPLLDYVPQDLGMYDGRYDSLAEADCRACHGDSLVYRHHYSQTGLNYLCDSCHDFISEPPGVTIIRDCTVGGCHGWDDVLSGNGWHHATDLEGEDNCVKCHNPNLVGPITAFKPFWQYPPRVTTPTPFSCENCHWDQSVVAAAPGFDPAVSPPEDAGHPSTYDHIDSRGNFIGYHEYGADILGNFDTHHMGFKGEMAYQCSVCHAGDPNSLGWDPYDPELIRRCEVCHNLGSLHSTYTHLGPGGMGNPDIVNGWEAVGFHAGGWFGSPPDYRPYSVAEMCWGCHAEPVPYDLELLKPYIFMNPQGVFPSAVQAPASVALEGGNFGESVEAGGKVQLKSRSGAMDWTDVPIESWSNDRIVFVLPCRMFVRGNYWVRVRTEEGNSNQVGFTFIEDGCGCGCAQPGETACTGTITLRSGAEDFGESQDILSAPGASDGLFKAVVLTSLETTYTALSIVRWDADTIKIKITDFFIDTAPQNFVQDAGEPTLDACEHLDPGTYAVYVRRITYSDEDQTGGFTAGDTITQVDTDSPFFVELTEKPTVLKVKPKECANGSRLVIGGIHFGESQEGGEVRIGALNDATSPALGQGKNLDRVKNWTDSKVVVRLKVKNSWQGKSRFVWVEKDGVKSNYQKVRILGP